MDPTWLPVALTSAWLRHSHVAVQGDVEHQAMNVWQQQLHVTLTNLRLKMRLYGNACML